MAKLYFKYGVMGSSKSAQALITKFNYEEQGMKVWLIKPAEDIRYGKEEIYSRIGLVKPAEAIGKEMDLFALFKERERHFYEVIIADEAQFFTEEQIEQLRDVVDSYNVPVFCYGLRTDFRTRLFPGSKRLLELADSIAELKTVCACGNKASVNARLDEKQQVITLGEQVFLGGNESYRPMCYKCWRRATTEENRNERA